MTSPLPPGFAFKPTDQTLIEQYLKPKSNKEMGSPSPYNIILDRNVYGNTPWIVFSDNDSWQIVGNCEASAKQKEIYVFTKLEKIDDKRIGRVAGCGTWDQKSPPRDIKNIRGEVIGRKKSFTFKVNGSSKHNEENMNGNWIMHEYTLAGSSLEGVDNTDYAICRILRDLQKCRDNSEAAVSLPTELTDEASPCIEEMTRTQARQDEAAPSSSILMTNAQFGRFIEENSWFLSF